MTLICEFLRGPENWRSHSRPGAELDITPQGSTGFQRTSF